jgi:hypothetical protein
VRLGNRPPPHGTTAPMLLVHRGCGGELDDRRFCRTCGKPLELSDVESLPGPGGAQMPEPAVAA